MKVMDTARQLRKVNDERERRSLAESVKNPRLLYNNRPSLKTIRVEKLKLILLDGTVNDIKDSIGRLQNW